MLKRYDEAVSGNELFSLGTAHVCPRSEGDDGGVRRSVILVAERAGVQGFLRPSVVCETSTIQAKYSNTEDVPLIAKARFIASVFIFFRASRSALSSIYSRSSF